jgi:hypothetical protein
MFNVQCAMFKANGEVADSAISHAVGRCEGCFVLRDVDAFRPFSMGSIDAAVDAA